MIPSAADAIRLRWIMIAAVRLVSIPIGLLALAPILSWLHEGLSDGDLFDLYYYAPRVALGSVLLLIGFGGLVLAGPLVRLLAPIPTRMKCPRCGYSLQGVSAETCPECGLDLSAIHGLAHAPLLDWVVWRARAVLILVVIMRGASLTVLVLSSTILVWEASGWPLFSYWPDRFSALWPVVLIAVCLGLLGFAPRIADRLVPTRPPARGAKPPPLPSQRLTGGNDAHAGDRDGAPDKNRSAG